MNATIKKLKARLKAARFLKKDVNSMVKRLFEEKDDCYSFLSHMTS